VTSIRCEDRADDVRVVLLNRPDRRNALDLDDRLELLEVLSTAVEESRAIVLSGTGDTFCAGGDLASMTGDRSIARERLDVTNSIVRLLSTGPRPVIAAVEGGAFGLGLGLAGACDVVVAGRSSRFGTAFARVGLGPDTGVSFSLPARVGTARARELLLSGRTVTAEEALRIGMVDELCDDGEAVATASLRAGRLATMSTAMVEAVKQVMAQGGAGLESRLAAETELQLTLLAGSDFAEGRRAFFERRTADFRG